MITGFKFTSRLLNRRLQQISNKEVIMGNRKAELSLWPSRGVYNG